MRLKRVVEGLPPAVLPLLRDGSLDFIVGGRLYGKLDPALKARPLFREEFAVAARMGHPLRHARSLVELAGADWLTLWPADLPGDPVSRAFSSAGLPPPRQVVQCESYNVVVSVLAKTDMLGMLSHRMLAAPLARESLQEIPIPESLPSLTVSMFTRADAPLTTLGAEMAKAVTAAALRLARSS